MSLPKFYPLFLSLLALALGGYNPWAAALPAEIAPPSSAPASPALVGADGPMSEYGLSPSRYDAAAVAYWSEIGFGVEYGLSTPALHRWAGDVRIKVYGAPTPADINTLNQVVAELNQLLSEITLSVTKGQPDIEIYFVPESRFSVIEPEYIQDNLGFFRVWWNSEGAIYKARILIVSEGVTQRERTHLIREELTQSLGLFKDSWRYPESIFYQGWTATNEYAPIDRAVISLLYAPQLASGMTPSQAQAALLANYVLETAD